MSTVNFAEEHLSRSALFTSLAFAAFAFSVAYSSAPVQAQRFGIFSSQSDIGSVLHAGSASYNATSRTYTLKGSGENMWMRKDSFHYLWKKTSGDIALSATIRFPSEGGSAHKKAALVIRQSLEPDAVYADAALHGLGLTALQYRSAKSDVTGDIELNFKSIEDAPTALRIEKRGNHITMYISSHGEPMHLSGASTLVSIEGSYYVGLGVCAHDKDAVEEAVFSQVELQPLAPSTSENAELHSTLETISADPNAPRATEIYTSSGQFEAPNWTRDGKSLIFDQGGRIMIVPSEGGAPRPIDTGIAIRCNGSHGLSPDGKSLAISCNPEGGPGSRVYIIPIGGGTPRLVTETPQSYFHSWSPDGKTIAFARPHPGGGDFFSIPVEGGQETRLTTSTGISDDPDYSPDGRYIYFNSDRGGGTMQIWRIHADGSNPEQITFDERNNWTPHVSPDGKSMVYISYDHSVTGHPVNKDIKLQLMSLSDHTTRTLVELVGGSGTMNVPSWAPDSKALAFVSYELADKASDTGSHP